MKWLIDTNVVSEIGKKNPDRNVLAWFAENRQDDLAISIVSLAELRFGVEVLFDEVRRRGFADWLEEVVRPMFFGRTLGLSEETLVVWRRLAVAARQQKRTLPQADSLIAATARHAGLTMCTRDVEPYLICDIPTFNPFTGERFNGA
jgi:toxin FitB